MAATVQTKPAPTTERPSRPAQQPEQHAKPPRAQPPAPPSRRAIVKPPPAPARLAPPNGQRAKRPRHLWSQKEKDFVRLYYRGTRKSRQYLASILNVSEHAVAGQVNRMGLCKRSSRAKWTHDEDEQLRTLIGTLIGRYPVSRISKIMGRTPNAISVRAKRLKPSRRDRDDWYTLTEVAEILGVDRHWVERRITAGTLKASLQHGSRKASKPRVYRIRRNELRNFIRRFPQELNSFNIDLITCVDLLSGLLPV